MVAVAGRGRSAGGFRCAAVGARGPDVWPAAWACQTCLGAAPDPDAEPATPVGTCPDCLGCGLGPVGHRLPRTRAHEYRAGVWHPARWELDVTRAAKAHHKGEAGRYRVLEIAHDWPGRAFVVAKVGEPDRVHQVYLGPDAVSCSCEGHSYLASARANQRAWEAGDETFPTLGCLHLDALAALLNGGHFDLGG